MAKPLHVQINVTRADQMPTDKLFLKMRNDELDLEMTLSGKIMDVVECFGLLVNDTGNEFSTPLFSGLSDDERALFLKLIGEAEAKLDHYPNQKMITVVGETGGK